MIDSGIDETPPLLRSVRLQLSGGLPEVRRAPTAPAARAATSAPKVIVAKVFNNKLNQTGSDALPIAGLGDHGTPYRGHRRRRDRQDRDGPGRRDRRHVRRRAGRLAGQLQRLPRRGRQRPQRGHPQRGRGGRRSTGWTSSTCRSAADTTATTTCSRRASTPRSPRASSSSPRRGNDGPGGFTLGSPGRARDIITVGASTNEHFVGQPVTYPADGGPASVRRSRRLRRAAGRHVRPVRYGTTAAPRCAAGAARQGRPHQPRRVHLQPEGGQRQGRGRERRHHRQQRRRRPDRDGRTAGFDDDIPAVMIAKTEAPPCVRPARRASRSARLPGVHHRTTGTSWPASAARVRRSSTYAIKPDLTSVGVNVLSSIVCTGRCCGDDGDWAFFNGTSMAAPTSRDPPPCCSTCIRRGRRPR